MKTKLQTNELFDGHRRDKIQYLLIKHLMEEGQIQLNLPNGLVLEVGITQENKYGNLEKTDDYCWLVASQEDRLVSIDAYNLGLRFSSDRKKMIVQHDTINDHGEHIKILDVC